VLQVTAKALGKLGSDPPRITDRLLLSLTNAQKAKKIATNILPRDAQRDKGKQAI